MQTCHAISTELGLLIEFPKNSTALDMGRSNAEEMKDDLAKVRERVAALEGHANAKPDNHPWALSILSILAVGCLGILGWTAKSVYEQNGRLAIVETDTQTSKTERFPRIDKDLQDIKSELKAIKGLLAPQKLEHAAKNSKSPQVAEEVKAAVSSAEASGTQIDLALVKEAGGKFIDAASVNSSAWTAANYCVSYRTTLSIGTLSFPTPTGPGKQEQTDDIKFAMSEEQEAAFQKQAAGTQQLVLQLLNAGPIVPSNKAYLLEFMSKPRRDYAETRPQFQIIDAHGAYIYLDGMRMRQIVIKNATVVYKGEPAELQSVYFVNCKFQINQKPRGIQFARQVLKTATATLSASG